MPRKPSKVPSYCLHKHSGRAVVRIDGRDRYLGEYGSPESHREYERLIAEWRASNAAGIPADHPGDQAVSRSALSVNEMILSYWRFAETYYLKDGKPTKELACMREALLPLRQFFGETVASQFGPKSLKAVRQHMIDQGLSRGVVNHRISRIKRAFRWATAEELVPPSVYHGLQAVTGLKYGRTAARETEPVKPVPEKWVRATMPFVSPPVAAMMEIQLLTGMRPSEVVAMRPRDIDQSEDIWIYEPHDHKNRWRNHRKLVPLGPKTQRVIRPFLDRDADDFMFSPQEAEEWRNAQRRKQRGTPMTPSQSKRKPKKAPKRPRRDHYDTDSFRQAIGHGIRKANKNRNGDPPVPHWCPLQVRHARGTEVRRRYRLEGAQAVLGHARVDVSQLYAEKNLALAKKIAREIG